MRYPLYTLDYTRHTSTGGCREAPYCISLTGPGHSSNHSVASVTGVGSSHHEGGSRGCVHCSIGGVSEVTTVNSYKDVQCIGNGQLLSPRLTHTSWYSLPHPISHTGSHCHGDSSGDLISTDTSVEHCP